MSWDVIAPFLKPLEPLLDDADVTDIFVNGGGRVFLEKHGRLQPAPDISLTERAVQVAARNIARVLGDDISPDRPLLDARLPDGSRVAAVLAPCSVTGTVLAIRKFRHERFTLPDLVERQMITPAVAIVLQRAVENRQNLLISGGTGTGKTTLLTALAAFFAPEERLVLLEDTAEIRLDAQNIVRLEARRVQPPAPAITMGDLLKTTLRLRPDRILLGEVRGGEAFELLQALNTGHDGSLSTIHARSASLAVARFTSCVLMSGVELPYRAIRSQIAECLDWLVHIQRREGRRIVTQVIRLRGYDALTDRYELETIYERT